MKKIKENLKEKKGKGKRKRNKGGKQKRQYKIEMVIEKI